MQEHELIKKLSEALESGKSIDKLLDEYAGYIDEEIAKEQMRKKIDSDAYWIIEAIISYGKSKQEIFDALPAVFIRLIDELKLDYGFEITAFTMKAAAYRKWIYKK